MAGSRPGELNGGATGCALAGKVKPLPQSCIRLICDYDLDSMGAMLGKISHLPFAERLDILRKNREQFRKPNAFGKFPNKAMSKDEEEKREESHVQDLDEDEDDAMGEDEDGKDGEDVVDRDGEVINQLMDHDNKPATAGQLQVRNEGERECKRPRY